jgi:hypothetical protein
VVLRDTYLPGMGCRVNGASVSCLPADGGMWTAVSVPRGHSLVYLNYVVPVDLWSAILSSIGLGVLIACWIVLLGWELYRRFVASYQGNHRRRSQQHQSEKSRSVAWPE